MKIVIICNHVFRNVDVHQNIDFDCDLKCFLTAVDRMEDFEHYREFFLEDGLQRVVEMCLGDEYSCTIEKLN